MDAFVLRFGIELIDLIYILTVVVFTIIASFSPKKMIAWALLGEFCLFIGFDVYLTSKGIDLNSTTDFLMVMAHTSFALLFSIIGSRYLSFISCVIAFYYAFIAWTGLVDYYQPIMIVFCTLQLGGLLPGVYDGLIRIKRRLVPNGSRGSAGYRCSFR